MFLFLVFKEISNFSVLRIFKEIQTLVRKFETRFESHSRTKTLNSLANTDRAPPILTGTEHHRYSQAQSTTDMAQNNVSAKKRLEALGSVTEEQKKLILLGMEVGKDIAYNWLTVGEDDLSHANHFYYDKFETGVNGGGWLQQKEEVIEHLLIIQPQETPITEVQGNTQYTDDFATTSEEEDDDEVQEDDLVKKTLEEFSQERSEQYAFCQMIVRWIEENPEVKNIVIKAEEKTGKREMVEIITLLTERERENWYFTAFNAKSINIQVREIQQYVGNRAHKCNNRGKMEDIVHTIPEGSIAHTDELDYGSGQQQTLAPLIEAENITKVFYSATTHELEKEMKNTGYKMFTFRPNATYRGSEWFLANNLVRKAEDFVDNETLEITEHGEEIIENLTDEKNIGIVRLARKGLYGRFKKTYEVMFGESSEGKWVVGDIQYWFVDSKVKKTLKAENIVEGVNGMKTVIFTNQCWRRSTELKGAHGRICFMHDSRSLAKKGYKHITGTSTYASLSQAVSRIKHYDEVGHRIVVYADEKVFKVSAGQMSPNDFKLYNRQGLRKAKNASAYAKLN